MEGLQWMLPVGVADATGVNQRGAIDELPNGWNGMK
jgi:hypothetical protein